jgi:DNA-binding NarL/FixJ family response regulator
MIRIFIADDHAIVRSGVKQILATAGDIAVVGEASNGAEVLDRCRKVDFDVLLLDMAMPGMSSIDLIRRLRIDSATLPILILSMYNEGQIVTRALKAGASGYVTKDSEPTVLINAVREVCRGGKFIDPSLVNTLIFEVNNGDRPLHETLSNREFEVLQMLASGKAISDIASSLNVSAKTVSTHKMRLMQKLHLESNADLYRYAIHHGLVIDLPDASR